MARRYQAFVVACFIAGSAHRVYASTSHAPAEEVRRDGVHASAADAEVSPAADRTADVRRPAVSNDLAAAWRKTFVYLLLMAVSVHACRLYRDRMDESDGTD